MYTVKLNYKTQNQIKENVFALLGLIGYFIIFIATYRVVISPIHSYEGLIYKDVPAWCWIFSIFLSAIPLLWVKKRLERPSDLASWILYYFLIIPVTIIPFFVIKQDPILITPLPIAMVLSFFILDVVRNQLPLPRIESSSKMYILKIALPIFVIIVALITLYLANFNINLSLIDVYSRRILARETVQEGSIFAYFISTLNKVAVPICIILGIQKKNIFYILLGLLGIVAIFSLQGTKSTIFTPIVVSIVMVSIPGIKKHGLKIVYLSLCSFLILSLVENLTVGSNILATFFVRREMVGPAQLSSYYWEYFSREPFVYLGDSILRWIPDANTIPSVGKLIGYKYFSNAEQNANANILASGFAQIGYIGMLIAAFGAGLVLNILDRVGKKEAFVPACAAACIIGLIYINGAFLTSLISTGIVLLILVINYYPFKDIHPNHLGY